MPTSYFIVENVVKTIEFYEKAFGFKSKFIPPEKDYEELISGETTIAFASTALANSNLKGRFETSKKFWKTIWN